MRKILIPSMIRDLIMRTSYTISSDLFLYKSKIVSVWLETSPDKQAALISSMNKNNHLVSYNQKFASLTSGLLIAIILSNPFDVVISKYLSQQNGKYKNISDCFR